MLLFSFFLWKNDSSSHPLAPSGTEERLPPMISPFLGHVNTARGEKGTVLDAIWVASDGEEALAEVSVPEGAFRQERFYDWPPDPFLLLLSTILRTRSSSWTGGALIGWRGDWMKVISAFPSFGTKCRIAA